MGGWVDGCFNVASFYTQEILCEGIFGSGNAFLFCYKRNFASGNFWKWECISLLLQKKFCKWEFLQVGMCPSSLTQEILQEGISASGNVSLFLYSRNSAKETFWKRECLSP
jgi:hypothetical protein